MHVVPMRRLAALALVFAASGALHAAPCADFTDVQDTDPFCTSIAWMKNRGITLGCTATLYCPNDFVRRDQMAAFMYRLGFQNAFLQGGNAFGTTAVLGTTDSQAVQVNAGGIPVQRFIPATNASSGAVPNLVAGHEDNVASRTCPFPTLCLNTQRVVGAVIAGGGGAGSDANRVTDSFGTIGGGRGNLAGDDDIEGAALDAGYATVSGGFLNEARAHYASIGGGLLNTASGFVSAVAGGSDNVASGSGSAIPGGFANVASGAYSFAAGSRSEATGDYSVALGRRARTYLGNSVAHGAFVFADSKVPEFGDGVPDRFLVRATGGVKFVTSIDGGGAALWSCFLGVGSGWACSSDRKLKQDLEPLDGGAVLDRLAAMPVYAWSPKGERAHVRHYGPTAQDFRAAFGLGEDDTTIGMQDADGVALAAIQGLAARDRAREAEVAALRARNENLENAVRDVAREVRALRERAAR